MLPACRPALQDYDAALQLIPRQPATLYRKGQVLVALKRVEVSQLGMITDG